MSMFKDFLDGGASSAAKANKKENAWIKQQYASATNLGESLLLKALAGIDTGFNNAKAQLGKAGETATMQILGQGKQALAQGNQALTDAGFSGTMAAQLPGQVAYQTNQALGQLGEALGAQNANLEMQHAQSKLAGAQSFGQWALGKVSAANQSAAQYQASGTGLLGGLGEGLGMAAGAWAGGYLPGGSPAASKAPGGGNVF
jgi:hypothetical protein